jgi:predicted nucleic acid-binding protein
VIDVFVDTSVLVTWFHSDGERDVPAARAVLSAHQEGVVRARVLDLAVYELGNVLTRALRWPADRVVDQVEDLLAIVGAPEVLDRAGRSAAGRLAAAHQLTYYDASWAAVAVVNDADLISADRALLAAGLATTASAFVGRDRS